MGSRRWGRRAAIAAVALAIVGAAAPAAAAAPPTAAADAYAVTYVGLLEVTAANGVLSNDTRKAGATVELRRWPLQGAVTLAANGSFVYRAKPGFEGIDRFEYRVVDSGGKSANAVVELTVNRGPRTYPDRYRVEPGGVLVVKPPGVQANDVDRVGGVLSTYLFQGPSHGQAVLGVRGRLHYTPDPGFVGVDQLTYLTRDSLGAWGKAMTVTLKVAPPNRAPEPVADNYQSNEDEFLEVGAPGVLTNDTDADGDTLTAELVGFASGGLVDLRSDGSFTFEPNLNDDGDVTFKYRVFDGWVWSAPVTVSIDVIAQNDPPVTENDFYEAWVGSLLTVNAPGVLANDYDPVEFDGFTTQLFSQASTGTVTMGTNGSFTFLPDPGPSRGDGFQYLACDGGGCTVGDVQLEIYGTDDE